jgi:phenylalanyl-tRNA synthetase beta chain
MGSTTCACCIKTISGFSDNSEGEWAVEVPYSWLGDWVLDLPAPEAVQDALNTMGYECTVRPDPEADLAPVTLVRIRARDPHPQRAGWAVLTVEGAGGQSLAVVTAARNGKPGDRVWYAPPGTTLPGGRTVTVETFGGIASHGMVLAAAELGYAGTVDEDLWVWRGPGEPGAPWRDVMGKEPVLELELTPSLAQHAQSVRGVARDLAARWARPVGDLPAVPPTASDTPPIVVEDPGDCPVYALQPLRIRSGRWPWLWARRLRLAGFRLIGPAVDATNYVLMDLGQPLHAFDADRVVLPITVRRARPGERLELLDGQVVELDPDDLVIADREGPIALAGVMGGRRTAVSAETCRLLVESAHFSANRVYRTARRHGLNTDAALRFGRGTDPEQVLPALGHLDALLEEAGVLEARDPAYVVGTPPARRTVAWRPERLRRWIGADWTADEMASVLSRLGFVVSATAVTVPSWRPDIDGEQDLAEEVARIRGMDEIPARMPRRAGVPRQDAEMAIADRVRDLVAAAGYTEVIPRNMIAPGLLPSLGLPESVHRVRNPLREEESLVPPTILPGLLLTVRYNADRDIVRQAVYAVAPVTDGPPEAPAQGWELGVFLSFGLWPHWLGGQERSVYDLKGLLEHLGDRLQWDVHGAEHPSPPAYLHPGRALAAVEAGKTIGWLGELHPRVREAWRLPLGGVLLLRLPADTAVQRPRAIARPSRFPAVVRDLSIWVPEGVSYAQLVEAMREAGGPHLVDLTVFDRFFGPQGESLTFRLTFQAADRTLSEEEVETWYGTAVEAARRLGARQR